MDNVTIKKSPSGISGIPDVDALSMISRFTRNTPEAENIYTFTVILCDNEIDRDYERFSVDALNTLKEMFVGVTGIFDHSMKSSDQTARIYKTEVVEDKTRRTAAGEYYTYLKAWCYMLRTDKNNELIEEIEAGIKKEVSVSCSVNSKICSVCGKDMRSRECRHSPGETVDGKVCHAVLSSPSDAYEWSFVAVPAQRGAGVSKSVKKKSGNDKNHSHSHEKDVFEVSGDNPEEIIKSALSAGDAAFLTRTQIKMMSDYIDSMRSDAENGKNSRSEAEKDIVALSAFTLPDADTRVLADILKKLSSDEVFMLKKALGGRAERLSVYKPAFSGGAKKSGNENSQFKI